MTPSTLHDRITLGQAHTAAWAGDLDRAARLLDDLDAAMASSPASLDLRARIHAQRGDLDDADVCWARVLLLHPENPEAAAGRATIARIRAGRPARPLLTAGRVAVLAAVLVTVVAADLVRIHYGDGDPPPATAAAPPDPAPAEIQRLERQIAAAQDQTRVRSRELDRIAATFTIPGVRAQRRATDVRLVFTDGLFRSGTDLARGSRPLLARVGRRLTGLRVSTTVVGHTVAFPGGRTSGGSPTAYARAQVAAQELATAAGLPLTAFTLATADQSAGPHPEAPRNRTVTLVLRPS
jgi:hypothetical protein